MASPPRLLVRLMQRAPPNLRNTRSAPKVRLFALRGRRKGNIYRVSHALNVVVEGMTLRLPLCIAMAHLAPRRFASY
jgi:hypothetical protein